MTFREEDVNRAPNGQFANKHKAKESGVELNFDDPSDLAEISNLINKVSAAKSCSSALSDKHFLDDYRSEVHRELLESIKDKEPGHRIMNSKVIRSIARRVYARMVDNSYTHGTYHLPARQASSDGMQSRKRFRDKLEALEKTAGRIATPKDVAAVAQDVRDTSDPRHRPPAGFHARVTETDLAFSNTHSMSAADEYDHESENYTFDEALYAIEDTSSRRERSLIVWDTLSLGAVKPHTVARRFATRARKTLDTYPNGVLGMIAEWDAGEDTPGTEALFLPFGGAPDDFREADRITAVMTSRPHVADDLYRAALMVATVD